METVIIGSGFVAKYPEGGGNFSVPLQYVLGLRRMRRPFLWLEVMQGSADGDWDLRRVETFRRRLQKFDLQDSFCLLLMSPDCKEHDLANVRFFGKTKRQLLDLVAGPCTLLNLSYSIHPPLLSMFSHRKFCSLDPTEICFWMQRLEMGQSTHDDFWSIGLNTYGQGSRVPKTSVHWKTYFPLVDTSIFKIAPRPAKDRFTTIGQWYWDGNVEFNGEWKDFSKRAAFEKFLLLPRSVPNGQFELAMNLASDDPEIDRLKSLGWRHAIPHVIARTPQLYYNYLKRSTAEFSAVKLESYMSSGWLSDRSAVYLALGRPVISEPTGAENYLPEKSGMLFVKDLAEATEGVQRVRADWKTFSRHARACAVECFDAVVNLKKILG